MDFIKKILAFWGFGSKQQKYKQIIHRKQKVAPNPPNELFIFAKNIAITQLNQLISPLKECHWIRNENTYPAFDHFNFMYKNKIFSVLIDIQDENGKSYLPNEYIKRQKYAAKVFNLIPCKFPVVTSKPYTFDVSKIKIKNNGWNLFHSKTGKEIILDKLNYNKKEEFSIWELRNYGIKYTIKYLQSKNYKVNSYQDVIGIDPQIWFYDENNKRSWVVVRCLDSKNKNPFKKNELESIINNCYGYNGYYAELTVESPDKNNKKLYRGDNIRTVNFDCKQIHSVKNPKRDILEEDVRELIKQSIGYKCIDENVYSSVYEIPNYNDYIFKIGYIVLYMINEIKISEIKENMILVPIKYKNNMEERKNLGLPVYYVTSDNSDIAKQGYAQPKDISVKKQRENAIIIRKVSGQDVSSYYMTEFLNFGGKYEYDRQFTQIKTLLNIIEKYGKDAGVKTLELCKNGISVIPKNDLAEGSPQYEFIDETTFYNNYKKFINSYIEFLTNLSNLPQESYNNAVNDILSSEDFTYNFAHPKNTFINFETQSFNFIDFYFDRYIIENAKKINMIEEFRNVLLGKNFASDLRPYMLIFYPEDWVRFEKYSTIITEKINNAAPEKNKLNKNY